MDNVHPLSRARFAEAGPIEILPGAELQVDQHGEYEEHHRVDHILFIFHSEVMIPCRSIGCGLFDVEQ